jgi:hypothetical protein
VATLKNLKYKIYLFNTFLGYYCTWFHRWCLHCYSTM